MIGRCLHGNGKKTFRNQVLAEEYPYFIALVVTSRYRVVDMRTLLLATILIVTTLGTPGTGKVSKAGKGKLAIAYFDEGRLWGPAGQQELDNFRFFLKPIQEIAKRDFPDVELRIVGRGELVSLPDGTRLNVQNVEPALGFILSARGKKRRLLSGAQTDFDFACAAASFYNRSTPACLQ